MSTAGQAASSTAGQAAAATGCSSSDMQQQQWQQRAANGHWQDQCAAWHCRERGATIHHDCIIASKSHHMCLVHTHKTSDHTMTLYNHTMCDWFTPSQSYSHLKMVLFIPTRFAFTPCQFCSHQQDFNHIMKFLYSHTPISDYTLQTWFTPSRP